jgi:hypothetical protein
MVAMPRYFTALKFEDTIDVVVFQIKNELRYCADASIPSQVQQGVSRGMNLLAAFFVIAILFVGMRTQRQN